MIKASSWHCIAN